MIYVDSIAAAFNHYNTQYITASIHAACYSMHAEKNRLACLPLCCPQ